MRKRIVAKLAWLGAEIDPAANAANAPVISNRASRIPLHVVPTNEELMIARHTVAVLESSGIKQRQAAAAVQGGYR